MPATETAELLRRLQSGRVDLAEAAALEQVKAGELLVQLSRVYPLRFQERRLREKWEVGMARSLRWELAVQKPAGTLLPIWLLIPVWRHCVMLSGEGDDVTGVAVISRLAARPLRKPFLGLALTTGRGFKLDKALEGWILKPEKRRTVKLTEEFLQKRGWQFDNLNLLAALQGRPAGS